MSESTRAPASAARRLAARIALPIVSVACILLITEGALRLVGAAPFGLRNWQTSFLHQPDPELIFSLRPNATSTWRQPEFVERVTTNSQGLRGAELDLAGNRPLIVVLGDSMTFGHGVGDEEPYPRALEAAFAASGQAVSVVNAGIRGYGTDQSFKLYATRLRALRPDLVILGHYRNDITENLHQSLYRVEEGRLVPMDATRNVLYRVGLLHAKLPALILRLRLTRVAILAMQGWGAEPLGPETHGGDPVAWSRSKALLEMAALDEIVREDGGRLLVLGVPSRDGPPQEYAWLRALDDQRIPRFDPRDEASWNGPGLFYREDDHLTAAGHERLAHALHDHIGSADLLPRTSLPGS